jgi:hypothetical protein
MTETDLKSALLLAAPRELPNLRLFVRPIMRVRLDDPDRVISVGIKGQADVYGLVRGGGHIELELKSHTGTMKKRQLAWRSFCQSFQIPHLVLRARAGESQEETVKRWVGEVRQALGGA